MGALRARAPRPAACPAPAKAVPGQAGGLRTSGAGSPAGLGRQLGRSWVGQLPGGGLRTRVLLGSGLGLGRGWPRTSDVCQGKGRMLCAPRTASFLMSHVMWILPSRLADKKTLRLRDKDRAQSHTAPSGRTGSEVRLTQLGLCDPSFLQKGSQE